jgi:hypothetical protein
VRVVNSDLKPRSPLVGTLNSRLVCPFSSIILSISPFLFPSFSIIDHANSLGSKTDTLSIGSSFSQFFSCIITVGEPT